MRNKIINFLIKTFPELRKVTRAEEIEKAMENLNNASYERPSIVFHGGCLGCAMQRIKGVSYCKGCKYFDFKPSSELPNLNNRDILRNNLKQEYKELA